MTTPERRPSLRLLLISALLSIAVFALLLVSLARGSAAETRTLTLAVPLPDAGFSANLDVYSTDGAVVRLDGDTWQGCTGGVHSGEWLRGSEITVGGYADCPFDNAGGNPDADGMAVFTVPLS